MPGKMRSGNRWLAGGALLAGLLAGCKTEQPPPPPRPKAQVEGMRVVLAPEPVAETGSEDCKKSEGALLTSLPAQLRRSAEKALSERGFRVLTDPKAEHELEARVEATVGYCSASEAHIATGQVALALESKGQVVSRGRADGDLANPLDPIFDELIAQLVYSPGLIQYADKHASGAKAP